MLKKGQPFKRNIIYEVILSSYNKDGTPNAAPMGILLNSEKNIILRVFNQSDTHKNLLENKICAINLTDDPSLYVNASLFQNELTNDYFIKYSNYCVPILKSCKKSFLILKIINSEPDNIPNRTVFICKIIYQKLYPEVFPIFTRAFSSLIEILIHVTRVIYFSRMTNSNSNEIMELINLINYHSEIIKKVSDESSIYQSLLMKINYKMSIELEKSKNTQR